MVSLIIGNNMLSGIDLVIFDKDGTLIDLNSYCVKATYMRAEAITKCFNLSDEDVLNLVSIMGIDITTKKVNECGPVGVKKREDIMRAGEDYLLSLGYTCTHDQCVQAFEEVDMELGERSGLKACIGVFSGSAPREALIQKTPYVIDNVGLIKVGDFS